MLLCNSEFVQNKSPRWRRLAECQWRRRVKLEYSLFSAIPLWNSNANRNTKPEHKWLCCLTLDCPAWPQAAPLGTWSVSMEPGRPPADRHGNRWTQLLASLLLMAPFESPTVIKRFHSIELRVLLNLFRPVGVLFLLERKSRVIIK